MSARELGEKTPIRRKAKSTLLYKLMALAAAFIWGTSFVVMKDAVDTVTPCWLLAMRFIGAGVVLGLFIPSRIRRSFTKKSLLYGSLFGALLFLGYWTQTVGLVYTTPGKNAFLTAVYCVLVPFGWWLVARKKPTPFNIIAAVVCLAGLAFVSLDGELGFDLGERWTLLCAVFYALHLMCVSKFSEGRDIYVLTMIQFLVAGLLALVFGLVSEPVPNFATLSMDFWFNLAFLALFASLLALLFQNIALKYVPPAQASLLLSLESVFGVSASVLFYGESLTIKLVLGFSLIFIGIVISETGASYVARSKMRATSKKEN